NPVATDDVCIDTPFAGITVTLTNSAASVHSLTAASTFTLINGGTATSLAVAANSVFLNAVTIASATLITSGTATTLTFDAPVIAQGTSTIGTALGITSNSTFAVGQAGSLTINGPSGPGFTNLGTLTLNSNSTLTVGAGTILDNHSTLTLGTNSTISVGPA